MIGICAIFLLLTAPIWGTFLVLRIAVQLWKRHNVWPKLVAAWQCRPYLGQTPAITRATQVAPCFPSLTPEQEIDQVFEAARQRMMQIGERQPMVIRYVASLLLIILALVAAELALKVLLPLLPFMILIGFGMLVLGGYIRRKRRF